MFSDPLTVFSMSVLRLNSKLPPLPPFRPATSRSVSARTALPIAFATVVVGLVVPTDLVALGTILDAVAEIEVPSKLGILLVGVRTKDGGSCVMNEAHRDAVLVEDRGEVLE